MPTVQIPIHYIPTDLLIKVHDRAIEKSGGLAGVKDLGLLESILSHIQNDIYYPTYLDKLTHLIFSIIKNHCFNDGNKRSSIGASIIFIQNNKNYVAPYFSINEYIRALEYIVVFVAENTLFKDDLRIILKFLISAPKQEVEAFAFFSYIIDDREKSDKIKYSPELTRQYLLQISQDKDYRKHIIEILELAKK